ncbi:hypothetical protein [Streptomyces sp. NPDC051132]|uniref:hypothetical protein n=1 Tax=unclassified Streptomyces TaxID=2593676 RepID=UPI0034262D2B
MAIQYFWRHPLAEQVREEGRQQGLKEALEYWEEQGHVQTCQKMISRILEWRGIPVPAHVRERVEASRDLAQLELWTERAVHATQATDLFTGE